MKKRADKKKEAEEKAQELHEKVKTASEIAAETILGYMETEGANDHRSKRLEKIASSVESACVLALLMMSTL